MAAGALSASGSTAIGATIDTAVYSNAVTAAVDNAVLTANCQFASNLAGRVPNRVTRRRGITVSATADNKHSTY